MLQSNTTAASDIMDHCKLESVTIQRQLLTIGPFHDPVTWYGTNYTGTQVTPWDFLGLSKQRKVGLD